MALPETCLPHDRAIALGGGKSVGTGHFARAAGDSKAFRASPELDAAVLALAGDVREEMKLGEGPTTDIIAVGVSATDYVGHTYGTQGAEMCIQLMALDAALGRFFQRLDRTGIDYVVMLTSDHGGLQAEDGTGGDGRGIDEALPVRITTRVILRLRRFRHRS